MLIILMVLVGGSLHPTYAWIDTERYQRDYHFLYEEGPSLGITARQACRHQQFIFARDLPKLKTTCVQQS